MGLSLTIDEFIKKAICIHGDTYDYSEAKYKGTLVPLKIICNIHGSFNQKPNHHLNGSGCLKCANILKGLRMTKTPPKYFEEVSFIHDNKYKYTESTYKNSNSLLEITCPKHGLFNQRASDHLYNKSGCPDCKKETLNAKNTRTIIDFVSDANKTHGNTYSYDSFEYINSHVKGKILCPTHGIFLQTPMGHLTGNGCPKCAGKFMDTAYFIDKASEIHKSVYDYSRVEYTSSKTNVEIICPEHGLFKQAPSNHLQGSGCPLCASYGFNKNKSAILYYILDEDTGLYKIGITNRSIEKRFGDKSGVNLIKSWSYASGETAYIIEQEILLSMSRYRLTNSGWPENLGGRTEFFNKDILHEIQTLVKNYEGLDYGL